LPIEHEPKSGSRKPLHGVTFRQFTVTIILTGLVVVMAAAILQVAVFAQLSPILKESPALWWLRYLTWTPSTLRLVGGIIISVGLLDILIAQPQAIDYARERLDEALQGRTDEFRELFEELLQRNVDRKEFLSTLPEETLDRAHANIIRILTQQDFREMGHFYPILRSQIEPLLGGLHYEKQIMNIDNRFHLDGDLQYLESRRWTRTTFHTWSDASIDIGFERRLKPLGLQTPGWLYELESYVINGQSEDLPPMSSETEARGICVVRCEDIRTIRSGQVMTVERREIVRIPVDDTLQWHIREQRSLRELQVSCTFNQEVHPRLTVSGFQMDGRDFGASEGNQDCHLEWEGWMLPHHGFTISWNDPRTLGLFASPDRAPVETSETEEPSVASHSEGLVA